MSTKNSLIPTKKYKHILSAVHMVYRLVNSTYNVSELILRLTRVVCQFIQTDTAVILIIDPKSKRLKLKAIYDNKINILIQKKNELFELSPEEKKLKEGYTIYEPKVLGLPLVADEIIGAIYLQRKRSKEGFNDYDKEILSVIAEQAVTAIKNLQLNEQQQKIILGSIEFIGKLLKKHGHASAIKHTPRYFKIVKSLVVKLNLGQELIDNLYYASVLRDAGAIDVPYDILAKSGQLTPEEFKIIRNQPAKSVELIRPIEFLEPVLPIILYHHEHYDGTGYPSGLKKEQIPIGARILAVVDAFDAMTHDRPYKSRLSLEDAIAELKRNSGTQFDPYVVRALIDLARQKKFRLFLSNKD